MEGIYLMILRLNLLELIISLLKKKIFKNWKIYVMVLVWLRTRKTWFSKASLDLFKGFIVCEKFVFESVIITIYADRINIHSSALGI